MQYRRCCTTSGIKASFSPKPLTEYVRIFSCTFEPVLDDTNVFCHPEEFLPWRSYRISLTDWMPTPMAAPVRAGAGSVSPPAGGGQPGPGGRRPGPSPSHGAECSPRGRGSPPSGLGGAGPRQLPALYHQLCPEPGRLPDAAHHAHGHPQLYEHPGEGELLSRLTGDAVLGTRLRLVRLLRLHFWSPNSFPMSLVTRTPRSWQQRWTLQTPVPL